MLKGGYLADYVGDCYMYVKVCARSTRDVKISRKTAHLKSGNLATWPLGSATPKRKAQHHVERDQGPTCGDGFSVFRS